MNAIALKQHTFPPAAHINPTNQTNLTNKSNLPSKNQENLSLSPKTSQPQDKMPNNKEYIKHPK